MAEAKVAEVYELKQEVKVLREQVTALANALVEAQKVTKAVEGIARTFGHYRGNDNRVSLGVIVATFPQAGTIDVLVLDSTYSGGTREAAGIEIGRGRHEFMPFLIDEPQEVEDDNLVAAERG